MVQGFVQISLTLVIVIILIPILGSYIANVFLGQKTFGNSFFEIIESKLYQLMLIRTDESMTGLQYARNVLISNLIMGIFVYLILLIQPILPFNYSQLNAPSWDLALHTTISFLTNTDQQHYSGETTLTYASQVLGLGFLMFTSAATGLAVGIAFIRGLTGKPLGNFYIDLIKSITRILLPISLIGAIILLISGVPETLAPPITITTLEGSQQIIPAAPIAHFEMIKQLGENGGGFFGANSAHPFENPNPFSNLIEIIAMLSIPTALIYTYGIFAQNKRQAWLIITMVFTIFIILISITVVGEYQGNPQINSLLGAVNQPNVEGKEIRFGWSQTALWAISTTATMCGAVNGMLDSLMPAGGFSTIFNLFLQIIWGGQGTGTAYLFIYLILTVFLTGLMVGRTPEFLGRKIEKPEIILASVILLVHPIAILIPSAITLAFPDNLAGISDSGFHGLTQVIYEYASASANNGSGFEGLGDNTLWWNLSCSVSLLMGRYIPIIALLLLADNISRKQPVPQTTGTLRTDTVLFTVVTGGIILILGALTFFPVLILGPIAEGFNLGG
jgi:potassium-transporting ATPase potassium-binding subunit